MRGWIGEGKEGENGDICNLVNRKIIFRNEKTKTKQEWVHNQTVIPLFAVIG